MAIRLEYIIAYLGEDCRRSLYNKALNYPIVVLADMQVGSNSIYFIFGGKSEWTFLAFSEKFMQGRLTKYERSLYLVLPFLQFRWYPVYYLRENTGARRYQFIHFNLYRFLETELPFLIYLVHILDFEIMHPFGFWKVILFY